MHSLCVLVLLCCGYDTVIESCERWHTAVEMYYIFDFSPDYTAKKIEFMYSTDCVWIGVCVCVWESSHCKNTPIENSVLYRWSMCAIFGFIHKHYMYGRLWPDNWAIPNPEMRDNNFILWWTVKDIKGNANANFRWCQRQINIIALDKMRKQFAVVVNVVVCYCNILAISCVAFHCIPVNDCSQF